MTARSKKNPSKTPADASNRPIGGSGGDGIVEHCVDSPADNDAECQNPKIKKRAQRGAHAAIIVRGAQAPSGREWINVAHRERSSWCPRGYFGGQAIHAEERLAKDGIVLIGHGTKRALLNDVAAVVDFPPLTLAEHSGWLNNHFVLPDGDVITPKGIDAAQVVFPPLLGKCNTTGNRVGWRMQVAAPLANYDLPSFVLMIPFAAPLLALTDRTDNIGFELVGRGGSGKSTLQQLAASAVGAPNGRGAYWTTLDTTLAGLENVMPLHNDLPLILDEANLYLARTTEGREARHMRELAFKIASGGTTTRQNAKLPLPASRFVTLISANQSFSALTAAARGEGFRAASDRLLSLMVPNSPGGAIGSLPEGFRSTGEFMDSIKTAATQHHGFAMRRFLKKLVERRSEDEDGLRRLIARGLATFRARAGVDENDGSARRVADAFGLVATAGAAAVQYRVLPRSFRCMDAALACYHSNRAGRA